MLSSLVEPATRESRERNIYCNRSNRNRNVKQLGSNHNEEREIGISNGEIRYRTDVWDPIISIPKTGERE